MSKIYRTKERSKWRWKNSSKPPSTRRKIFSSKRLNIFHVKTEKLSKFFASSKQIFSDKLLVVVTSLANLRSKLLVSMLGGSLFVIVVSGLLSIVSSRVSSIQCIRLYTIRSKRISKLRQSGISSKPGLVCLR